MKNLKKIIYLWKAEVKKHNTVTTFRRKPQRWLERPFVKFPMTASPIAHSLLSMPSEWPPHPCLVMQKNIKTLAPNLSLSYIPWFHSNQEYCTTNSPWWYEQDKFKRKSLRRRLITRNYWSRSQLSTFGWWCHFWVQISSARNLHQAQWYSLCDDVA